MAGLPGLGVYGLTLAIEPSPAPADSKERFGVTLLPIDDEQFSAATFLGVESAAAAAFSAFFRASKIAADILTHCSYKCRRGGIKGKENERPTNLVS